MLNARKILHVDWPLELQLMNTLRDNLLKLNINASNAVVVAVSTDYSSIVAQYLRHQLSYDGEICVGFGVDVPYPDEEFDDKFVNAILALFYLNLADIGNKKILLVESGVIRGGNYTKVHEIIRKQLKLTQEIYTLTLFENFKSKFKSDFVGRYYDDSKEDLTFWWEKPNKHWPL
jgi:hypothetical protein